MTEETGTYAADAAGLRAELDWRCGLIRQAIREIEFGWFPGAEGDATRYDAANVQRALTLLRDALDGPHPLTEGDGGGK